MSKEGDDALGELYGWDSTIDEVFELAPSDPQYDEDRALDAYEQIIGVGGQEQQQADAVLSLAAQLLTKHFFKFPHVHSNVVQVLVKLTDPTRSQAVRIHTIRSLLQIVKATATGETLDPTARGHIQRCTDSLLELETSNMIVRQLSQLKKLLTDTAPPPNDVDEETNQQDDVAIEEDSSSRGKERKDLAEDLEGDKPLEVEESPRNERNQSPVRSPRKFESRERRDDDFDSRKKDYYQSNSSYDDRRRSNTYGESTQPRHFGNNCPPSPYLFVGGIPRHATQMELARFFEPVDPSITASAVQIKMPPRNQTVYAFVMFANSDLALEGIRFVKNERFLGRTLNSDFARGPPCATLLFVELDEGKTMHDEGAVHNVDFASNPDLWKETCHHLESYGELDIIEEGKIRFRDIESAKMVIRKHHITVLGRDIIPVYFIVEQIANTAARRRRNSDNSQGFALKSGRVVGTDDTRHDSYSRDGRDDYRSSRKSGDDYRDRDHDRRYSRDQHHDHGMDNDHRERGRERDSGKYSRKQTRSPSPVRSPRDVSPRDRMPREVLDRPTHHSESFDRPPSMEARREVYPSGGKSSTRMERDERGYYPNRQPARESGYNGSPELKRRDSRQTERVSPPYRDDAQRVPAEWAKERSTGDRHYSRGRDEIVNERQRTRDHSPIIVEERLPQRELREQDRVPSTMWNDRRNQRDVPVPPFDERKYGGGMGDRRPDRRFDEPTDRHVESRYSGEMDRRDNRPMQRQDSRDENAHPRQRSPSPLVRRESNTRMGDERDVEMSGYRRSSGASSRRSSGVSLRKQDDRSIGEIAREEQERQRHLRRDRDMHQDVDVPVEREFNYKGSSRSRQNASYRAVSPPRSHREASRSHSSRHFDPPHEAISPRGASPPQQPVMRGRSPQFVRNDRYRSSRDDKANWSGNKRTRSRSMENAHRRRDEREFHHSNRRDNRRERGSMRNNENYVPRENKRVELMATSGKRNATGVQSPVSPMIASPKTRRDEDTRMESAHASGGAAEDLDECMVDYEEDDNDA